MFFMRDEPPTPVPNAICMLGMRSQKTKQERVTKSVLVFEL
jgi:hypothetical protein